MIKNVALKSGTAVAECIGLSAEVVAFNRINLVGRDVDSCRQASLVFGMAGWLKRPMDVACSCQFNGGA